MYVYVCVCVCVFVFVFVFVFEVFFRPSFGFRLRISEYFLAGPRFLELRLRLHMTAPSEKNSQTLSIVPTP